MEENIKEINKRIIKYRKLAGLTQTQVAESIGMKRNTYSHMERYGNIPPHTAKALAKLFGVTVVDILYGEDVPNFKIETPEIKFSEPDLLNTTDVLPLSSTEANGIRLFRSLPKDEADAVIDYLNEKYRSVKQTVNPFGDLFTKK